jgi:hypothetical protein
VAQGSRTATSEDVRTFPHVHIPLRARPFIRLAIVAAIVVAADMATEQLTRRGGSIDIRIVTALRVALSLSILRYPLAGFVFSLEVDKWDWYWLGMPHESPAQQAMYQDWDKAVDLVVLGIAAMVVTRWPDLRARNVALGMFAWRVIGVVAFFATDDRRLLIAFPNVFESMFLVYLVFRVLTGQDRMLESNRATALVALALLIPKVAEEYFLHALEDRPWNMFHVLPDIPYASDIETWMWGASMYVLPLIALVVLMLKADGRATRGDPEIRVAVA